MRNYNNNKKIQERDILNVSKISLMLGQEKTSDNKFTKNTIQTTGYLTLREDGPGNG